MQVALVVGAATDCRAACGSGTYEAEVSRRARAARGRGTPRARSAARKTRPSLSSSALVARGGTRLPKGRSRPRRAPARGPKWLQPLRLFGLPLSTV